MSAARLVAVALLVGAYGAGAAELPSRAAKPKSDGKARSCEIDGERGVVLPGGGCVKIGGYVSVGATAVRR